MAKVHGEGKIPKRIDEYVIYPLGNDMILRRVSGFTAKALKKDPKYERSRNNAGEFGNVSALCKKMRVLLKEVLPRRNNLEVCNSLVKIMRAVMVLDAVSSPGKRNLARAFENEAALKLMTGYNFNPLASLKTTFKAGFTVGTGQAVSFASFDASKAVVFPEKTNSAGMCLHQLRFDFEKGEGMLVSSQRIFFGARSKVSDFVLEAVLQEEATGVLFSILEIQFYASEGGEYVPHDEGRVVGVVLIDN